MIYIFGNLELAYSGCSSSALPSNRSIEIAASLTFLRTYRSSISPLSLPQGGLTRKNSVLFNFLKQPVVDTKRVR